MNSYALNDLDLRTAIGDLGIQPIVYEYRTGPMDSLIHEHRFYEIHYLLHGRIRYTLDGAEEVLGDGEVLIIGPETRHTEEILSDGGEVAVCFSFSHKTLRGREHDRDVWALLGRIPPHTYARGDISPAMQAILDRISVEYAASGATCASMLRLLVAELVLETLRPSESTARAGHALPPKNIADRAELLINEYFQKVFTGRIRGSSEELAAQLFISPRQLSRTLHRICGKSFAEMLTDSRILGAAHILRHTDLPIHQVAERMGFCSPSAFCAAFKQYTGVTPLTYRREPFELL